MTVTGCDSMDYVKQKPGIQSFRFNKESAAGRVEMGTTYVHTTFERYVDTSTPGHGILVLCRPDAL